MSDNSTLKSRNAKYFLAVLIVDLLLLALPFDQFAIANLQIAWSLKLPIGIGATAIAAFALAANHLLPRRLKEIIVFLRLTDAQPGCRAFSERVIKDNRINISSLKEKTGNFPTVGSAQNALWYKLLKLHEGKPLIKDAHKNYLLFRDLTSLSFMLCIIIGLPLLIYKSSLITFSVFALLLIQYIVFMIAAQNTGNSLVENVLAEASCQ